MGLFREEQFAAQTNLNQISLTLMEQGLHDYLQIQRCKKTRLERRIINSDQELSESACSSESEGFKEIEGILTMADKVRLGMIDCRELIFLQSQSNIIEKTLGEGESIMVRPESLVAFSSRVSIKRCNEGANDDLMWLGGLIQFNSLSLKSKFVKIKGPGLIYIDMKQSRNFFKRDQISVYIIVLYILLYFTMFMVILLERRDPLPLIRN
jgi:hypothetical protein